MSTPAEDLDFALKAGGDRFWESFQYIMRDQSQGGRTPGLSLPPRPQTKAFFDNTNPAYWQTLARIDPREAQSQIQQYKAVS